MYFYKTIKLRFLGSGTLPASSSGYTTPAMPTAWFSTKDFSDADFAATTECGELDWLSKRYDIFVKISPPDYSKLRTLSGDILWPNPSIQGHKNLIWCGLTTLPADEIMAFGPANIISPWVKGVLVSTNPDVYRYSRTLTYYGLPCTNLSTLPLELVGHVEVELDIFFKNIEDMPSSNADAAANVSAQAAFRKF